MSRYHWRACNSGQDISKRPKGFGKDMVSKMGNDYRKLTRSRENRMICGVCGGLGEYLNIDPTIVRIIWIFCALAGCGTGALVYLIASVIIPEKE